MEMLEIVCHGWSRHLTTSSQTLWISCQSSTMVSDSGREEQNKAQVHTEKVSGNINQDKNYFTYAVLCIGLAVLQA